MRAKEGKRYQLTKSILDCGCFIQVKNEKFSSLFVGRSR